MRTINRFLRSKYFRLVPTIPIALAMFLVVLIGVVGLVRDLASIRQAIMSSEINQARSHAERTAGRLEKELGDGASLDSYKDTEWLLDLWKRTIVGKPDRLYAALVDLDGRIIVHSWFLEQDLTSIDTERRTKTLAQDVPHPNQLGSYWDSKGLPDFGQRVFEVNDASLSNSISAIDVSVPVVKNGALIGLYHAGIELDWLRNRVRQGQGGAIRGWSIVIASIVAIVLVSTISLYRLGVRTIRLEQELESAEARRLADLSRLIVGMAHELRNPLNAVRLNLFTSEKFVRGDANLQREEAIAIIQESVSEIERVDELIGQLLGYARVDTDSQSAINVNDELLATLQFLKQIHEHHGIRIEYGNEIVETQIEINRKYFRQVLLNLLHNARQALSQGGDVCVNVKRTAFDCLISIQDNGPGVSGDQYDKIFEPFYSTREDGVGMGLAVVKSLVESAGGSVECRRSWKLGGMEFLLSFPLKKD